MSHFLQIAPDGKPLGVWKVANDTAMRIGVADAKRGQRTYFEAEPGESVWDTIRRRVPDWFGSDGQNPFHLITLQPGQYYPRMARPMDQHPGEAPGWSPGARHEMAGIAVSLGQLAALTAQLARICRTVHPVPETLAAFGHDIRNLLIIACTEVEAHWRGVLASNGVAKQRYTTNDYMGLRTAMRLDEYAIAFPAFPWLEPMWPFKSWGATGRPTRDLVWYDDYNAVKHARETQFSRATLRSAFEAVSACVIMMVAQFGVHKGLGRGSEPRAFFHLSSVPSWPPTDIYIYPYGSEPNPTWSPTNYPFRSAAS